MEIRELESSELEDALKLVWEVFSEYEVSDYSEEGINEFWNFIHDTSELKKLSIYGAFDKKQILGVLAGRKEHISLFFVDQNYQGKGIGRKLFNSFKDRVQEKEITVNSFPYSVKIYEKLGFNIVDKEQIKNGIRYVPMKFLKK